MELVAAALVAASALLLWDSAYLGRRFRLNRAIDHAASGFIGASAAVGAHADGSVFGLISVAVAISVTLWQSLRITRRQVMLGRKLIGIYPRALLDASMMAEDPTTWEELDRQASRITGWILGRQWSWRALWLAVFIGGSSTAWALCFAAKLLLGEVLALCLLAVSMRAMGETTVMLSEAARHRAGDRRPA